MQLYIFFLVSAIVNNKNAFGAWNNHPKFGLSNIKRKFQNYK